MKGEKVRWGGGKEEEEDKEDKEASLGEKGERVEGEPGKVCPNMGRRVMDVNGEDKHPRLTNGFGRGS